MKLTKRQSQIFATLEESGAEHVTTVANTVGFATLRGLRVEVEELITIGLIVWGRGEIRDGRYEYLQVDPPDWKYAILNNDRLEWVGTPPLLMLKS